MSGHNGDRIADDLRLLATDPPADLARRLFAAWTRVTAPTCNLYVAYTGVGVSFIRTAEAMRNDDSTFLEAYRQRFDRPLRPSDRVPAGLLSALRGRTTGRDVPVDLERQTDFERDVLAATRTIPAGQTRPYGWIARQIGRPRAVRAVGTALGNNPVPLLIPCHRVVRAGGQLGEYVFGGALKEQLLRAENVNVDEVRSLARRNVFYVGSDTTGIFCYPTCAHARRITGPHRRGFRTTDVALRSGYRPCKQCRPMAESA
jgi:methylated-DNA-[protein]-cysteine S-methyltransferase